MTRGARLFSLAALALAALAPALAAERVTGVVYGPDDRPLAGARVRLAPEQGLEGAPEPIETGADGRWAASLPEAGRWRIVVDARGYFQARGFFDVATGGRTPPVDVILRSLDEVSPAFSEGNPGTVLRWVEKGNTLLEQGRPGEARGEYEKALGALPRAERPQVLQAIARTHFLEGDLEAAIASLRQALLLAPGDGELRRLFRSLLDGARRGGEVERLLAEIEAESRSVAASAEPAPTAPAVPAPRLGPAVEPAPGRTGSFRAILAERSPLGRLEALAPRFGTTAAAVAASDPVAGRYELPEESFQVWVPESDGEEAPYGLLVWISPTPFGGFQAEGLGEALAAHRLIWVGAHRSGNARSTWDRSGLALDAVHNLRRLYAVDERRVYVAGYSGGGRVASSLAYLYPEVFRGGFFLHGCDYFAPVAVPDRPGGAWPAAHPPPPGELLERVKRESRFVLLTGELDFNRAQTKAIWRRMQADGFAHLTYLEIPGADHYHGFAAGFFDRAVRALDAR